MALTIVEAARAVTGGVDTHLDTNVAAALDDVGGLLGVEECTTDAAATASCAPGGDIRDRSLCRRRRHRLLRRRPGPIAAGSRDRGGRSRPPERPGPPTPGQIRPRRRRRSRAGGPVGPGVGSRQDPRRQRRSDPSVDGRQAQRPTRRVSRPSTRSATSGFALPTSSETASSACRPTSSPSKPPDCGHAPRAIR